MFTHSYRLSHSVFSYDDEYEATGKRFNLSSESGSSNSYYNNYLTSSDPLKVNFNNDNRDECEIICFLTINYKLCGRNKLLAHEVSDRLKLENVHELAR